MKENIHVGLDADLVKAVRAYAARHRISLAAAISVLLTKGLEEDQ